MVAATIDVIAERGAAGLTVGAIVARAGVSRRTFYEIFGDAEDCFAAALSETYEQARACVLDAYDPGAPWRQRIREGLAALLAFIDAQPNMGRLLIVESLGAGPRALELRGRVLGRLVAVVEEGRSEGKGVEAPPLAGEGVVGAVTSVIHSRLAEGGSGPSRRASDRGRNEAQPMLALIGPLMSMIVLPYLGPAAARRELSAPAPKPAVRSRPTRALNPLDGLSMRLTYRTICVLRTIAELPGASNRQIGHAAGIADQGQISKLLARLQRIGLIENDGAGATKGAPNAWTLTQRGVEVSGLFDAPRA